jgi:hypothetical protein
MSRMDARIPINYRSAVAVRTIVEHGIAPGLSWQVVRFGRHSVLDAEGSKRAEAQLRALLATSVGWPRSAREGVGGSPANALLSHLLLIELRAALAQYAYMGCRDVSASDEADALARSAPSDLGALLLCLKSGEQSLDVPWLKPRGELLGVVGIELCGEHGRELRVSGCVLNDELGGFLCTEQARGDGDDTLWGTEQLEYGLHHGAPGVAASGGVGDVSALHWAPPEGELRINLAELCAKRC